MNLFIEVLQFIGMFLYLLLKSFIELFYMKHKDIKGQVVLITGAASGIGREMAFRFATQGCYLILWDNNEEKNEETAKFVKELGAKCKTYHCDISDKNQINATAEKVKKEVGEVDILVNNAGIVSGKTLLECTDQQIEKTMAVNTMAHFWTVRAFLPKMLLKNQGHIVNIASLAGLVGIGHLVDYCTSKFAAVGFSEALNQEIRETGKIGVHITCVCPYYIDTGMFKGVTLRFPGLIPMLSQDYVADMVLDGVLKNKQLIQMPRICILLVLLKHILPISMMQLVHDFFETSKDMYSFVGNKNKMK